MYMSRNLKTFGQLASSYIYAVGYLEKRSMASKKYTSLPFSSTIGPQKINMVFVIRFNARYMRSKLVSRDYRLKIPAHCCARFALRCFDY